jgi:hypothetical protein
MPVYLFTFIFLYHPIDGELFTFTGKQMGQVACFFTLW